jgi:hypothetical protein
VKALPQQDQLLPGKQTGYIVCNIGLFCDNKLREGKIDTKKVKESKSITFKTFCFLSA